MTQTHIPQPGHAQISPAQISREMLRRTLLAEMGVQPLFLSATPRSTVPWPEAIPSMDIGPSTATITPPAAQPVTTDNQPKRVRLESLKALTASTPTPSDASMPTGVRAETITADRAAAQPIQPSAESIANRREPVDVPVTTADAEPISFAFAWIALDERLAVIAQLEKPNTGLTGRALTTLQNIVGALDPHYKNLPIQPTTFVWPLPDDLGLPADAAAATQTVSGFVARRLRDQKVSNLLILADNDPFYLFAGPWQRGEMLIHPQFGFGMLLTHSLHAMLADPGLKRPAWQAMQTLLPRLQAANV